MKNFLLLLLFAGLLACSEKTQETQSKAYIPELVITDSLVIDNLTQLALIDVKEDHSEYLFYDFKTNEFLRVDSSGEILMRANRTGDGKNNYKSSYFYTANFSGNDEILLTTSSEYFRYDLNFSLKESNPLEFTLLTRKSGKNRAAQSYGNYLYTFSVEVEDMDKVYNSGVLNISYPLLTIRDLASLERLSADSLPKESQPAIHNGMFLSLDPIVQFRKDEMFVLFPNSPEIYVYNFPELKLKSSWELSPPKEYKQTLPTASTQNFDSFFNDLAGSQYIGFTFSNDHLVAMFEGAVPQEEVDALPRNVIGDERYMALEKKYKSRTYYQIFQDEEKLWEGTWDVNLNSVRNVLYSYAKPGEDPEAVEKDVQTIYFYELK
ncbi:hypothetical protein [Algoriphagus yeomjeoni]|uniref:6-bladed beta-propeller protein n=1 Tax=Algoriphagus yeomjeoni TaxID=291403 RepID=A0A327P7X6_9BACT|nr:hypothetical protein [Algoriphagus yeomjeoni]RAI88365.1 hypothetical protein LV83_02665 [Algoriphagus yeomjeoni]